jgi:uncharacterized protein (DUF1810 family)
MDLNRFIEAHEENFDRAFKEIKSGKKTSHWMWYIFPQLEGLGTSPMAKKYAIRNLEHAELFINHPILGVNLIKISKELLKAKTSNPTEIMGNPDDLKLKSCMTLFSHCRQTNDVFIDALAKFYQGELDERTEFILKGQS